MSALIVPCAHCDALNRIPAERLADRPACGVCGEKILRNKPQELVAASYPRQTKGDLPLLIDVWASWCGPCRQFAPVFAQAAQQLEGVCRLATLNSEQEQQLAGQLGIRSIPSLLLFKNAREVARHSGAMSLPQLLGWLKQHGVAVPA